jgi:hypothetical protein
MWEQITKIGDIAYRSQTSYESYIMNDETILSRTTSTKTIVADFLFLTGPKKFVNDDILGRSESSPNYFVELTGAYAQSQSY